MKNRQALVRVGNNPAIRSAFQLPLQKYHFVSARPVTLF